jgi:hypothetical protein
VSFWKSGVSEPTHGDDVAVHVVAEREIPSDSDQNVDAASGADAGANHTNNAEHAASVMRTGTGWFYGATNLAGEASLISFRMENICAVVS